MSLPNGALDTSPEASRVLIEGWRQMTPGARMALVDSWSRDVRALAELGIRRRRPTATTPEVLIELGRLLYGADVITDEVAAAVRAYHRTRPGAG